MTGNEIYFNWSSNFCNCKCVVYKNKYEIYLSDKETTQLEQKFCYNCLYTGINPLPIGELLGDWRR